MQIIVTHVTRMKPGYICVAGVDPATGKQVRPVLGERLTTDLLRKNGGVFEIGAVVSLGAARYVGHAPETEDYLFAPRDLRYLRRAREAEFWNCLTGTAGSDLRAIFGPMLQRAGSSCIVELEQGGASLGHLARARILYLGLDKFGKPRIIFSDGHFSPNLSVTDIRLCEDDHTTAREEIMDAVADRIEKASVVLALGLSRPYLKAGDATARHWLQVNNIHFEEDPLGEIFRY